MIFSDLPITFKKATESVKDLWPLLLSWGLWCFLHSFLLSERVRKRLERKNFFRRYGRLLFNLFSLLTVLPLVFWTYFSDGPYIFPWPSWAFPIRLGLFLLALYLSWAAFKVYGFWEFLGFKEEKPILKREGILKRLRHPLYTAGFIFLWIRDQTLSWFWTDILLSIYLLIGTRLEEKKLRRIFPEYEKYAKEVPPFWPRLKIKY